MNDEKFKYELSDYLIDIVLGLALGASVVALIAFCPWINWRHVFQALVG